VSLVAEGFNAILAGNAFANAFWVSVGVVAGALVQHGLGLLNTRAQRKYARKALNTEIALNIKQIAILNQRIQYLRERIGAGQIQEDDLFVSMQGFDYSIVNPLVMSGHFHVMLGHEKVESYFDFMKFFNNQNASLVNSMLRTEHEEAKSLDYLSWLEGEITRLGTKLRSI
jgi:hypothetical protein